MSKPKNPKALTPAAEALKAKARELETAAMLKSNRTCPHCGKSGVVETMFGTRPHKLKSGNYVPVSHSWCKECRNSPAANPKRYGIVTIRRPKTFTREMRTALLNNVALRIKYDELWHQVAVLVPPEATK